MCAPFCCQWDYYLKAPLKARLTAANNGGGRLRLLIGSKILVEYAGNGMDDSKNEDDSLRWWWCCYRNLVLYKMPCTFVYNFGIAKRIITMKKIMMMMMMIMKRMAYYGMLILTCRTVPVIYKFA